MSSSRLRFKDTSEDGSREHRKKKREHRKRKKQEGHERGSQSKKRSRFEDEPGPSRKWASSDEDMPYGHSRGKSPSSRSESAERQAREEKEFQQKLFDNLADDEQLDSTEAHFNDYAHVPHRWASHEGPSKRKFNAFDDSGLLTLDPNTLDDEDYAEWVRAGMYRCVSSYRFQLPSDA